MKAARIGAMLMLAGAGGGAQAQGVMADVIGATVANMNSGWPEACLSLERPEKPKSVARFAAEAEPALRTYLERASARADIASAYKRSRPDRWSIDRVVTTDFAQVRDPWAGRVQRLEPVAVLLGRSEIFGYGVWRAYGADNALLGTYEAETVRKTKGYALSRLKLWSPGQEGNVRPLTPFCAEPGDHETYAKAKAAAEAKKAKRRAEKEARPGRTTQ